MFRRNYFRAIFYAQNAVIKEKTKNTLVNSELPLSMPEGHFVLFAGFSSNSGVLGNNV